MVRTFRIRDTQRFLFLTLLFPLIPMLLAVIQPAWTFQLLVLILFCLVLLFRAVLQTRECFVGEQMLCIDRGFWEQRYSHEDIHELCLIKNNGLLIQLEQRQRIVRMHVDDIPQALLYLQQFAARHDIPLSDKRARPRTGGFSRPL